MQTENLEGQESIFDRDSGSGKMSSVLSQVGGTLKRVKKSLGRIFKKSSKRSSKLKNHTFMLLDLRPGAGNMLGAYWEYDPPWLGSFGTLNTSECPKDAVECSLWQILQATAPSRYSLSQTACLGILRRAECRGKSLPPLLEAALRMQAGLDPPAPISGEAKAYHIGIYRLYLPNKQADVLYSSIPRNALRLRLEPPPSNVEAVWDNGDVLFFARYEELLNTSSGYAPEAMGEDECIGILELDEKLYSAQAHYINALTGDYREMPYGYVYLPMPRSKENIALNGEAWWLDV